MSRKFQSWLAPLLARFVALKRAGGYLYNTQERALVNFDRYLDEHVPKAPFHEKSIIAYLASLEQLSPKARDTVINVVWQALSFAQRHDAKIAPLPPRPPRAPRNFRLRPPRIVSHKEICSIIAVARRLSHPHHLCSATYATLFGLLFATGIRIHEALGLDVGDFNIADRLLTIRCGKFDKSRILPLKTSTSEALVKYIRDHRRLTGTGTTDPIYVSSQKRRMATCTAGKTFRKVCITASIDDPLPRLHDLRHSFTVHCVVKWYRANCDVNALLPVLSTYLGHVSVENTRTYLRANGLLLEEAGKRFSARCAQLDEVLS
jgi:integrase